MIAAGVDQVEVRGIVGACWYWRCSCGDESVLQVSEAAATALAGDHADGHLGLVASS